MLVPSVPCATNTRLIIPLGKAHGINASLVMAYPPRPWQPCKSGAGLRRCLQRGELSLVVLLFISSGR